jgi:hypothetical protein
MASVTTSGPLTESVALESEYASHPPSRECHDAVISVLIEFDSEILRIDNCSAFLGRRDANFRISFDSPERYKRTLRRLDAECNRPY